jgi:hypothetical protein
MKTINEVMGEAERYLRGLLITETGWFTAFSMMAKDRQVFITAKRIYDTFSDYGALQDLPDHKVHLGNLIFESFLDYPPVEETMLAFIAQDRFYALEYDPAFQTTESFLIGLFARMANQDFDALCVHPLSNHPKSFNAVARYLVSKMDLGAFAEYLNGLSLTAAYELDSQLDVWQAAVGFISTLPEADKDEILKGLSSGHRRAFAETDLGV